MKPLLSLSILIFNLAGFTALYADVVEPAISIERTHFVLGEPIFVRLERRSATMTSPGKLMEPSCDFSVYQPSGELALSKTNQGMGVYDGPSQVRSLSNAEFLNDLVQLRAGAYRLTYVCGDKTASQTIDIEASSVLSGISVTSWISGEH